LAGGGGFTFTVLKGPGVPLSDVNCYVFNEAGSYLGMSDATDAGGQISFNLADGAYKIRVDYLGYQFWSPVYTVTGNLSETFTIAHQDVTLTVQGDYPSTEPIPNIPVYLFNEAGSYLGQNQTTDTNGQVVFNLPELSYKVRADYMSQQFWSNPFTWQDTTVTVPMADAEITVTSAGAALEGVNVYAFTASSSYLSLNGATNEQGKVTFNVPAGDYKFRADYQGSQYWSNPITLTAGQINSVSILAGGGGFTFTVLKGPGVPLSDVNCYVFNEAGSYLGMSDATDAGGQISFNLADGTYKIRVDYLGYQFWSPVYTVTGSLSEIFTISHQDVTITVQGDYPSIEPITNIPVYLFSEAGSYLSQNKTTDTSGQVVFNLPEKSYKVRADILGQQFWSDHFTWQNTTVTINQGMAAIHVVRSGSDVAGANVYLFSESGAYLGKSQTTDESGKAEFLLSNTSFKFRVDEGGNQYWSPVVTIQAGIVNNVEINISPVTVNISADPETIQLGESATLTWSSSNADTCVIEPGIGSVDVNGSIQVSPTQTTAYTITANGPSGTATTGVTVTVNYFLETNLIVSDSASGDNFGQSVSISGDYSIIGAPNDDDDGIDSGSAYIFKKEGTTWTQQAKLTANDSTAYDYFGWTVSISGGYAVVGAYGDDDGGIDSGAVYIFKLEDATWIQQAKLTANDAVAYDYFGHSVSISSDYVVVGAYGDDDGGVDSGSAYIFKREGTTWTQQAKLTANDAVAYDYFGHSVSISSDYIIVGAYGNDDGGESSGAAYIFNRDGEQTKITAGDAQANDYFGWSVDISGNHAIVGAYGDDDAGVDAGAAYVFSTSSPWTEKAKLIDSDGGAGALFGWSVAVDIIISEQQDAQDRVYIAVGAPGYYTEESQSGAIYTFSSFDGVIYNLYGKVIISDMVENYEYFGRSVDTSYGTIVVGAPRSDIAGQDSGSASIFSSLCTVNLSAEPEIIQIGESSTLIWSSTNAVSLGIDQGIGAVSASGSLTVSPQQTTTYTITATGFGGMFTEKATIYVNDPSAPPFVDISADPESIYVGGNLILTWISTNTESCVIEPDIGAVDINGSIQVWPDVTTTYTITATGPIGTVTDSVTVTVNSPLSFSETKLTASDALDLGYFGDSVSIYGDTAIVGAPDAVNDGVQSGAAYIFKYDGSVWVEEAKLIADDGAEWDFFGRSVSIYGDTVIVGADGVDSQGYRSGAAYVFKREGSAWTEQGKLTASDATADDYFGSSVSIYGEYAIIGAEGDDDNGIYSGAAYILKREGSTWSEQAKLTASNGKAWASFGHSVSIYGDYAIVGDINVNDAGTSNCAAYIFKREGSSWVEQTKLFVHGFSEDGSSVSIYKDYAIVGTTYSIHEGIYQGAAYIFKRDGSIWDEQAQLTAGDPAQDNFFGSSVSIYKDYAVVGASGNYENGSYIGAAYIFKQEGFVWSEQNKLTASDADQWPICDDIWDDCPGFGEAVALHGGNTIIGAGFAATDGIESGAAYIYSIPTVTVELNADPGNIMAGESLTLSWNSDQASSCVIEPGIGAVNVDGSITVSPTETTSYTITATGPAGTTTDSVIVNVVNPSVPPTVNLNVAPATIQWRRAAILSWNSTNANSATIDQGIGDVDPNGSLEVSPTEPTTYTITVTGPAGSATKSITVAVSYPIPAVSISADSNVIVPEVPITLSWTATDASTCIIEPGIGHVGLTGSISVLISQSTTFTITAANPGASATDSVTVSLPEEPWVDITASPNSILQGESSTLIWSSTNANSCWINPGYITVDLNGSLAVSPNETTTYYIYAEGPGGQVTDSVTVNVTRPVTLQITSPVNMQAINRPDIMVEGTMSNYLGNETGVTVNGQVAMVFNDRFVANHVPLQDGENTITVIGTDSQGYTTTAEITVYANTSGDYITVTADAESGVSPFETTLRVDGTFSFLQEPIVTPSGPDTVDPLESLDDAQYRVGMSTPGIYYFTAEVSDDQSNSYTDTIAVVVLDQAQLDALLRAKWNEMRQALIDGDIESASAHFRSDRKTAYYVLFQVIPNEQINNVIPGTDKMKWVEAPENKVRYAAKINIVVNGVPTAAGSYIIFTKDDDGLWKIGFF
jgi:FG-GAP repeat protein/glucodextranase-like protein